jgi:uncharacterized protein YmfQ (DUF2313 family)
MNKFEENLSVIGKLFDRVEYQADILLNELFANFVTFSLDKYEKEYQLKSDGSLSKRRARAVSAIRSKGGLSKAYLKSVGDALGDGVYTIAVTEGSGKPPFIVHSNSSYATPLPGVLRSEPVTDSCYSLTITVTGGTDPEEDLEALMEELKPAWTDLTFTYV